MDSFLRCLASFLCGLFVGYITRSPSVGIEHKVSSRSLECSFPEKPETKTNSSSALTSGMLQAWLNYGVLSYPPSLSGIDVIGKPRLCEIGTNLVAKITATKFCTILRACRLACKLGAPAPFFVFMQALLSHKVPRP